MATNLEMDGDRIVLNPREPSRLAAFIYTLVYLGLLGEVVSEVIRAFRESRSPFPLLILLVVVTLIWAYLMRNFASRIVFDPAPAKIYKKTLIGYRELMDFADIAGIDPVEETYQYCRAGTYHKIARRGDRYGKGVRLTATMNDKDLAFFEKDELPVLIAVLEKAVPGGFSEAPAEAAEGVRAAGASLDDLRHYRRNGEEYVLPYRRRPLLMLVVAVVLAGYALVLPNRGANGGTALLIATGLLVLAFFSQYRLVLDAARRTITHATGFGLLKKTYSFDDFECLSSSRETVNFIPAGTSLFLKLSSRKAGILLGKAFLSARKLDRLGDETRRILASGERGEAA